MNSSMRTIYQENFSISARLISIELHFSEALQFIYIVLLSVSRECIYFEKNMHTYYIPASAL
jgi:hypothetical protein